MTETHRPQLILRRIGAVLAGFLAIFILSTATDVALHATGVFPPWGQPMSDALFLLATAYRIVFGVVGCYIAARLAPDRPMQHALALGVVGFAVSILGAVATWDRGPAFGPPLVSSRDHRDHDAVRLGGRQTPRHAVARTRGPLMPSSSPRRL